MPVPNLLDIAKLRGHAKEVGLIESVMTAAPELAVINPLFPPSGPPMSFHNGLHPKSKLLAVILFDAPDLTPYA